MARGHRLDELLHIIVPQTDRRVVGVIVRGRYWGNMNSPNPEPLFALTGRPTPEP